MKWVVVTQWVRVEPTQVEAALPHAQRGSAAIWRAFEGA
jgi:hypothetical protein